MERLQIILYYIPIVVLFGLAIFDLIVGVANDAVNFTNSAIGSRVAPRRIIMLVASIGIVVGAMCSGGMFEIARKGVIYPQYFTFDNVIVIFLAVMFSDVILLDLFNTYGLPTSTTVSFVFELLGGAVAISMINLFNAGSDFSQLAQYINSGRALLMIASIFLSVLLAFTFGAIVQFLTRLLFTFRTKKHPRTIGAIWSALAISFIFYYILMKGLAGSTLFSPQQLSWLKDHTVWLMIIILPASSITLLFMSFVVKINPLKIVVMSGTFALALAFAANDLVNFIGVPLAGLLSYQINGFDVHSGTRMMGALSEPTQFPLYFLLSASAVMIVTLWLSRKAKHVTQTEVELARQAEGRERFKSSRIARFLVETTSANFNLSMRLVPSFFKRWVAKRYRQKKHIGSKETDISPAFDLVRASVNLMVASSLISFGTYLKLPLSTTYVTFMVAMGSSVADGAWDIKNAPYRVNGVLIVIGGWFLTGLLAFSASFIFAAFIHYGGTFAILLLILTAVFFILRTHKVFGERQR